MANPTCSRCNHRLSSHTDEGACSAPTRLQGMKATCGCAAFVPAKAEKATRWAAMGEAVAEALADGPLTLEALGAALAGLGVSATPRELQWAVAYYADAWGVRAEPVVVVRLVPRDSSTV